MLRAKVADDPAWWMGNSSDSVHIGEKAKGTMCFLFVCLLSFVFETGFLCIALTVLKLTL